MNSSFQHLEERFYQLDSAAAESEGKHVGTQQHHSPRFWLRKRRTKAAGVAANQVQLQCFELGIGYPSISELPEARVDAVHGLAIGEQFFDDPSGDLNLDFRGARKAYSRAVHGHTDYRLERQRFTGQFNHEKPTHTVLEMSFCRGSDSRIRSNSSDP